MTQLEPEKMLKCTVTPYKPAGSALAASFSELNQFLKANGRAEEISEEFSEEKVLCREKEHGSVEELLWSGNACVLSRKRCHGEWERVETFTRKAKILKAFWANFETKGINEEWIVLVEESCCTFIAPKTAIVPVQEKTFPFSIQSVFEFQPCTGILITVKKSRSPSSDRLSSVYFLKHPADEITPIWSQELSPIRKAQRIIWTGSDAKKRKLLCFQLGNVHRLAILDRLTDEEKLIAETAVENNALPSFYFDGTLSSTIAQNMKSSKLVTPKPSRKSGLQRQHKQLGTPKELASPLSSKRSSLGSRRQSILSNNLSRHHLGRNSTLSYSRFMENTVTSNPDAALCLVRPRLLARPVYQEVTFNGSPVSEIFISRDLFNNEYFVFPSQSATELLHLDSGNRSRIEGLASIAKIDKYIARLGMKGVVELFSGPLLTMSVNVPSLAIRASPFSTTTPMCETPDVKQQATMAESTPVISGRHLPKRQSGLVVPTTTFSPLTPGLDLRRQETMTPRKEELTEKLASLSKRSFKLTHGDGSTQEITVKIRKDTLLIIRRTFELVLRHYDERNALKIYSDWLIFRSSFSDSRDFTHFLDFIQDFLAEESEAPEMPLDKKKNIVEEEILKVANEASKSWPRSFVENILNLKIDDCKAELKPSGKHNEFYRLLFLVHEEMSVLILEGKRVKRLRKIMWKLAYSDEFREYFAIERNDQFQRKYHPMKVPNIQDFILALLGKENRTLSPLVDPQSSLFLVACLYSACFIGISPQKTLNELCSSYNDFITTGTTKYIEFEPQSTVNVEFLAELCSLCSPKQWTSLSPIVKLPLNIILDDIRDPEAAPTYSGERFRNLMTVLGHISEERNQDFKQEEFESPQKSVVVQTWDGMDCLKPTNEWMIKLFPEDLRSTVAASLLDSSIPVIGKNVIDQANAESMMVNAEPRLRQVSRRTVARTVGRGLATLATHRQMSLQTIRYPKVDLSMRLTAGFSDPNLLSTTPPDGGTLWDLYPQFNNAVATTLSLADNLALDGELLAIPKADEDDTPSVRELATLSGAILGLGLRGYLNNEPNLMYLSYMSGPFSHMIFMASAVFLGYCCNPKMQGTQDLALTRLLSLHLPFMMPEAQDEDTRSSISVMIQYCAIISLGFLHKKTLNQRFAKLLLEQIDSPVTWADKDHPKHCYREAYATLAGCALGLILQGKGADFDDITQALRPLSGCGPEIIGEEKVTRTSIEGCKNNTWVTAAGGISALALSFLGTNNKVVTDWLTVPNSDLALSKLRPVNVVLMSTAIGMINIESIEATEEWIESLKPAIVKENGFNEKTFAVFLESENFKFKPGMHIENANIDFPHRAAVDVAITSGAVFALGLKFMGTQNQKAAAIMQEIAETWLSLTEECHEDLMSSAFIHHCIGTVVLAWSMVKAGSGDVECLRMCRKLSKILPEEVNFGLHLATCQATGFLFLGGCKMSLKRDHDSIATMFVALMPKYPSAIQDNSQYVWILRHLAALCVEFRACIPQMNDGYICREASATVLYQNGQQEIVNMPGVLPPIDQVETVTFRGSVGSYKCLPLVLRPEQIKEAFSNEGKVLMKRECEADLIDLLKEEANAEARKENVIEEERKRDWWVPMDHVRKHKKDNRVKFLIGQKDQKGTKNPKQVLAENQNKKMSQSKVSAKRSEINKELDSIIRLENKTPRDNAYFELYTALAYDPNMMHKELLDHVINNMDAKHVRKEIIISLLNRNKPRKSPTAIKSDIDELAALFDDELGNALADFSSEPVSLASAPDSVGNWTSFKDQGFY